MHRLLVYYRKDELMKFIYPAVIRKTEEGKFQASFPDLECCYAVGDTLEEAVDNANEMTGCIWKSLRMEICLLFQTFMI